MSKYAPIYRCLICGRIAQRAGEHEPLELDQHQAEVLAQGLADSSRKKPSAREKVPYAGYHDCWGNGKNIGAKDCGIPTPLTFYTKLPSAEEEPEYVKRLYEAFYMEHPKEDEEVVKAYLEERVIPKLKEMGLTGHVFVKNGRFSNKFNANGTCNLYGLHELYRAIILINYEAICCGAEGADEIVVRKFIESSAGMTPCIYNGLPLRPEFRVFYDFDARKPIFTANYWDYDYVYPHLYHATDKIIFEHERERLEGVYAHFKDAVQDKVADAMQNVQGLTGQWSVDVLMDEREKFWLIDMAIAQRSAYWEMRPEGYAE